LQTELEGQVVTGLLPCHSRDRPEGLTLRECTQ